MVQAVCTGPVRSPSVVVAYGLLGKALAHFYVQGTANKGGVTRSTHSEVTGEGAVTPPELVVLLPGTTSGSSNLTPTGTSLAYAYEEDVSSELLESAREYLNNVAANDEFKDVLVTTVIGSDVETSDSSALVAVLQHMK